MRIPVKGNQQEPTPARTYESWVSDLHARSIQARAALRTCDWVARRIAIDFVDMLLDEGAKNGWRAPRPEATGTHGDSSVQ